MKTSSLVAEERKKKVTHAHTRRRQKEKDRVAMWTWFTPGRLTDPLSGASFNTRGRGPSLIAVVHRDATRFAHVFCRQIASTTSSCDSCGDLVAITQLAIDIGDFFPRARASRGNVGNVNIHGKDATKVNEIRRTGEELWVKWIKSKGLKNSIW